MTRIRNAVFSEALKKLIAFTIEILLRIPQIRASIEG